MVHIVKSDDARWTVLARMIGALGMDSRVTTDAEPCSWNVKWKLVQVVKHMHGIVFLVSPGGWRFMFGFTAYIVGGHDGQVPWCII